MIKKPTSDKTGWFFYFVTKLFDQIITQQFQNNIFVIQKKYNGA